MTPIIRTFTGRELNPLDLRPGHVCIEDIAHALALCNRFAGHTAQPISVAQHSVYVAKLCGPQPKIMLYGLLHDASEAYLGDITKWVKGAPEMAFYREREVQAQMAIEHRFLLPWTPSEIEIERLDWADRVMVRFEGQQGLGQQFQIDHPRYPPLTPEEIQCIGDWSYWEWSLAEREFLRLYHDLVQYV